MFMEPRMEFSREAIRAESSRVKKTALASSAWLQPQEFRMSGSAAGLEAAGTPPRIRDIRFSMAQAPSSYTGKVTVVSMGEMFLPSGVSSHPVMAMSSGMRYPAVSAAARNMSASLSL